MCCATKAGGVLCSFRSGADLRLGSSWTGRNGTGRILVSGPCSFLGGWLGPLGLLGRLDNHIPQRVRPADGPAAEAAAGQLEPAPLDLLDEALIQADGPDRPGVRFLHLALTLSHR